MSSTNVTIVDHLIDERNNLIELRIDQRNIIELLIIRINTVSRLVETICKKNRCLYYEQTT